jgi:hypothetical protein
MKALSIRQPWAWLIVNGYKDVENRTWESRFRGEFLIHAGKTFYKEDYHWLKAAMPDLPLPPVDKLECGGIVGKATMVDCVTNSSSDWFEGPIGFVLENAEPVKFIPLSGRLNFFNVDDSLLNDIETIKPKNESKTNKSKPSAKSSKNTKLEWPH